MRNKTVPLFMGITVVAGCVAPGVDGAGKATLEVTPRIQSGAYRTQSVINAYTQASVDHLVVKLYKVTGTEFLVAQQDLASGSLTSGIVFNYLNPNTNYRVRAHAYKAAGTADADLISVSASSSVDITVGTDLRPAVGTLPVQLGDRVFRGLAQNAIALTGGTYLSPGTPTLTAASSLAVTTLAGSTTSGATNGTGAAASFKYPNSVAVDGSGSVYVADTSNHMIRKITPDGIVTTLAGSTTSGSTNGTGTAAKFYYPAGVAVDSGGNVYVADESNHQIRKITPAGVVSTLAGSTTQGSANGTGAAASFKIPCGVAVDGSGNVYVADTYNCMIRKITPAGVVTTLAGSTTGGSADGTGAAASFNTPRNLAVDGSGNVYVADTANHRIRKITPAGVVTTLAGSSVGFAEGTGTAAAFSSPWGIAVDGSGSVYVGDCNNNKVRKITPAGVVTTYAGVGQGHADGSRTTASFSNLEGVALDSSGSLYVADTTNHMIRKIQ